MRKTGTRHDPPKGSSASRGTTVLGTPAMTSYGLFHQPAGTRATSSRNASKAVTAGRDVSASSDATKPHRPTGDATSASAAPAFEAPVDDDSSNAAVHRHSSNLLERHTSAAKDGVIDMLTTKASKLGVSLERALLAKKEAEDSADRQQMLIDQEILKRKDAEHQLQQKADEFKRSEENNGHLKWEVDALRVELQDAEERTKGWLQEETERRRSAEEAMAREHAVVTEYLADVYREGNAPEIRTERGATAAEVLVRELHGLVETLKEREGELAACAEQMEQAVSEAKGERGRCETIREQLVFTQERLEAARHKTRQLSSQLEVEAGDNAALRTRLHAMEDDKETRVRSLQERKAKAQQRKRGDTRDMMAESKAKDDRIKSLESTLMQERTRLEGELQSARSDYEEAARESRRKTARLQRRCVELEYRVATQSKSLDGNSGGSREVPPAAPSSSTSFTPPVAGLISASSMLPWRRGSASSETSTSASATPMNSRSRLGSGSAAAAAAAAPTATTRATGRGGEAGGRGGRGGGAQDSESVGVGSFSSSSSTSAASGARRASADRLPDPSRHNEGAPAWMRADLAIDRVRVD